MDHLMATFGVYIDESLPADKRVLVMSACVSPVSKWNDLNGKWEALLKMFQVPYFHLKDFFNNESSLLKHLSNDDKRSLLLLAIELVKAHVECAFTTMISPREYKRLTTAKFRNDYGSAYRFSASILLLGINNLLTHLSNGNYQIANIFIEDGHPNAHEVINEISLAKQGSEPMADEDLQSTIGHIDFRRTARVMKIGTYGLGTKVGPQAMLPLQTADIFAYAANRIITSHRSGLARGILASIEQHVDSYNCQINEANIRSGVAALREIDDLNARYRRNTYNLKKHLRQFGFHVEQAPYGIRIKHEVTAIGV
jgi:hypothetical protein